MMRATNTNKVFPPAGMPLQQFVDEDEQWEDGPWDENDEPWDENDGPWDENDELVRFH